VPCQSLPAPCRTRNTTHPLAFVPGWDFTVSSGLRDFHPSPFAMPTALRLPHPRTDRLPLGIPLCLVGLAGSRCPHPRFSRPPCAPAQAWGPVWPTFASLSRGPTPDSG